MDGSRRPRFVKLSCGFRAGRKHLRPERNIPRPENFAAESGAPQPTPRLLFDKIAPEYLGLGGRTRKSVTAFAAQKFPPAGISSRPMRKALQMQKKFRNPPCVSPACARPSFYLEYPHKLFKMRSPFDRKISQYSCKTAHKDRAASHCSPIQPHFRKRGKNRAKKRPEPNRLRHIPGCAARRRPSFGLRYGDHDPDHLAFVALEF